MEEILNLIIYETAVRNLLAPLILLGAGILTSLLQIWIHHSTPLRVLTMGFLLVGGILALSGAETTHRKGKAAADILYQKEKLTAQPSRSIFGGHTITLQSQWDHITVPRGTYVKMQEIAKKEGIALPEVNFSPEKK